jgi:hypothetical protein
MDGPGQVCFWLVRSDLVNETIKRWLGHTDVPKPLQPEAC